MKIILIDKDHIERYEIKQHDIQFMNTEKLPISHNWIKYEDVLNYLDIKTFQVMFPHEPNRTFKDHLNRTFDVNQKNKYLDVIYDILVKCRWAKITKDMDLDHVVEDIRFALQEKTHVIKTPKGGEEALNSLEGVKELLKLINRISEFLNTFGNPSHRGSDLTLKLFLYFILDEDTLRKIKESPNMTTNQAKTLSLVFGNLYLQLKEMTSTKESVDTFGLKAFGVPTVKITSPLILGQYIDKESYTLKSLITTQIESIETSKIDITFIQKLKDWNIPIFFKPVLVFFEDLETWATFIATENFAEKIEIMPIASTTFNQEALEAKVKFTNSLGIREDEIEASAFAHDTKVDIPAIKPISCKLPKNEREKRYCKLYIFHYKTDLTNIKRFFYKGITEGLVSFIQTPGYEDLLKRHDNINMQVDRHMNIENFIEDEFLAEYDQHEYYIKDKSDKIKMPDFAYRGSHLRYSPNHRKWDDYVPANGPMGKFYDHRK